MFADPFLPHITDGFYGGDCSLRVCPVGSAFVDTPAGDLNHDGLVTKGESGYSLEQYLNPTYKQHEQWPSDASEGGWAAQPGEAHFLVECSGKGACDRYLGVCRCYDGYTGSACQRSELWGTLSLRV